MNNLQFSLNSSGTQLEQNYLLNPSRLLTEKNTQEIVFQSLEEAYRKECTSPVDLSKKCEFNYLSPNEKGALEQKEKFQLDEQNEEVGVGVEPGTERLFATAVLVEPKFKGLVGRDINPEVKLYNDYNILMLRLAENINDYIALSSSPIADSKQVKDIEKTVEFGQRVEKVRELIEKAVMPGFMKEYYKNNLNLLAKVYYSTDRLWKETEGFVHYFKNDEQFSRLQSLAKTGNIIATVGDIGDLKFLTHKVSLLGLSNIPDYTIVNIECNNTVGPLRVIWTILASGNDETKACDGDLYRTKDLKPLDGEQTHQFKEVLKCFEKAGISLKIIGDSINRDKKPDEQILACNSAEFLSEMIRYRKENILEGSFGALSFGRMMNDLAFNRISQLSTKQLTELVNTPGIEKYPATLVFEGYRYLKPEAYCAFSKVKGWKEEFSKLYNQDDSFQKGYWKDSLAPFFDCLSPEIKSFVTNCKISH